MSIYLDLALALALLISLAIHFRKPQIVTEYRDREVPIPAPPLATPFDATIRVKFLGDFGHVDGEMTIPAKARRPVLTHHGARYGAERMTDGEWIYRRIRH